MYYQACCSYRNWHPVTISSSDGESKYMVLVSPWSVTECICQCEGYRYRGKCRHQAEAARSRCDWTDFQEETQEPEERINKICPRCGGPTRWEVEVIEDDN